MRRKPDDAVRITTAQVGKSVDISSRQARYLFSMGVRTLCFVLAIVTTGPLRWVFLAGAFLLPYVAVVIANAGSRPDTGGPAPFDPADRLALGAPLPVASTRHSAPRPADESGAVVPGVVEGGAVERSEVISR
jgi:hypothetical protein